jgi:hypothetical protein
MTPTTIERLSPTPVGTRRPSRHHIRRSALRLAVLVGITVVLSSSAFASTVPSPKITATQVTFNVPAGRGSTFTLELWSDGTLLGSAHGTSGVLTVAVPVTAFCRVQGDVYLTLQADVFIGPPGGHGSFYSGARATLPGCATLAGNIYLCSASGAQTTTEVAGGTLAATGPKHVPSQSSPLSPVRVPPGTYAMSAAAPAGYSFVACGGSATVGSGGTTASQPVVAPTGVGNFYVTATVPPGGGGGAGGGAGGAGGGAGGAGGGAGGAGGGAGGAGSGSGAVAQTSAQTIRPPALAAGGSTGSDLTAAPVAATAVGSSALAFTGMDPEPLLLAGLTALALGTLSLAVSRLRRRPAVVLHPTSRRRP